jgi:hypothetical protein
MSELLLSLWKSGQLLAAGVVAVYLVLTLVGKVDTKRAFYYAGAAGVLSALVDGIAAGHQLQWGALVTALIAIVSLIIKGPDLAKPKTVTVVVGDSFAHDSPAGRVEKAKAAVEAVLAKDPPAE